MPAWYEKTPELSPEAILAGAHALRDSLGDINQAERAKKVFKAIVRQWQIEHGCNLGAID